MNSEFEIYALRLAKVDRLARDNFLNDPCREGTMGMDFNMWIVRNRERVIAVDTGFSKAAGERRNRHLDRTPAEAAKLLRISPSEVTDLVITHMHYDHAGNLNDFPNARIWIQKSELEYVAGASMRHATLNHFFEADDVCSLIRANFEGRVTQVDGNKELAKGIEIHHVGGHTPGLQMLRVKTQRGWVVLASDALHYYDNFESKNPFPGIVDVAAMMDGYDVISALAEGRDHIIPGHDPQVGTRFPDAVDGRAPGVWALHLPPGD